MSAFLVTFLLRTGLISVVAALIMLTLGKRNLWRRIVGRASVALCLLTLALPIESLLGAQVLVETPQLTAGLQIRDTTPTSIWRQEVPVEAGTQGVRGVERPSTLESKFDLEPWLVGGYGFGVAVLLAWIWFGVWQVARLRKDTAQLTDSELLNAVSAASQSYEIQRSTVREATRVGTPFVAGWLHPTLYLPSGWLKNTSKESIEAVLLHECAHISNCDLTWMSVGRILTAFVWLNPLVWWINRDLQRLSETIADQHVISFGVRPQDYANCLLDHQRRCSNGIPEIALSTVGKKSSLSHRIEVILATNMLPILKLSRMMRIGAFMVMAGVSAFSVAVFGSRPLHGVRMEADYTGSYETQVMVYTSDGTNFKIEQAELVFGDGLINQRIPLRSSGSTVFIPKLKDQHDFGTLYVRGSRNRSGFVQIWPSETKVSRVQLRRPIIFKGTIFGIAKKPSTLRISCLINQSPLVGSYFPPKDDPRFLAKVDSKNGFNFEGLPAKCTVMLSFADESNAVLPTGASLTETDPTSGVTPKFEVSPGGYIVGRVVKNGQPVAGVTVNAQQVEHSEVFRGHFASAVTNSLGSFVLQKVYPAEYNIVLTNLEKVAPDSAVAAQQNVMVRPGDGFHLPEFKLKPGSLITGTVVDGSGQPLNKVGVGIHGPAFPGTSAMVQVAWTDEAGVFKARVPPGAQRLYMYDSRYVGELNIKTKAGVDQTVELRVKESQTLRAPGIQER